MKTRFLRTWQQASQAALAQGRGGPARTLLGGALLAVAVLLMLPIALLLMLFQLGLMLIGAVVMLIRGRQPRPVVFHQTGYRREKVINPDIGGQ
ncbi:hypothetical protein [Ferrimonas balearica]|uniref:hypothetical protein n=1 Tax=Ferrimonas balearica TaxID=44012 RepID=UPI001C99726D|nr:hypothetical protein [Ferrimonas balearica]MBY5993151.1 hypothetical protein [Ferrimonas balearica]